LWLNSPPAQPPDTVGDTVGATKKEEDKKGKRKSFATNMVADPYHQIEIKILEDEVIAASPIALPDDDEFVRRLVHNLHEKARHVGAQIILGKIKEKFWLLNEQRAVKKIVIAWWTHRRRLVVAEPPLPIPKTGTGVPFEIVGVGKASPLLLKMKMRSAHRNELDVLLLKVEKELNNRSLTYLKETSDDPIPLKQIVVVRNSGLSLFLETDIGDAFGDPAAHRRTQDLKEALHSRSRKECQGQFCHQKKKMTPQVAANPEEAVLVAIKNENRRGWSLGAIVEANPGKVCAIRTNNEKTWAGAVTRPT